MKKWKVAFKNKFYLTVILATIGLIFLLVGIFYKDNYLITTLLSSIGTSLVSASVTIFLVKYDIMDLFKQNNISNYGIVDIKSGRDRVFHDAEISSINCRNWEEFMKKSSDKTIDIVGISMYSFLWSNQLLDLLLELSSMDYKIRIIFADPNNKEVEYQSREEQKPGKLAENITYTVRELGELIRKNKSNNIEVYYSLTLPRAFIVRSGCRMTITPYLLKGPFLEPTIVADKWCVEECSYYNSYFRYIEDLIKSANKII